MDKDPPGCTEQSDTVWDDTAAKFRDLIKKISKEVTLPEPTPASRAALAYHDRITAELAVGFWTIKKEFFEGPLDLEVLIEPAPTPQVVPSAKPRQQTGQTAG